MRRRARRRERVFWDRTHPLEKYYDLVYKKFRFHRQFIFWAGLRSVTGHWILFAKKRVSNTVLQVCLALRFNPTGSFQSVVGELIGVDQATACRTITSRVADALMLRVRDWIKMPTHAEADRQKQKFYATRATPGVIQCIDGTHIHIQGPNQQEHEFVNRMN